MHKRVHRQALSARASRKFYVNVTSTLTELEDQTENKRLKVIYIGIIYGGPKHAYMIYEDMCFIYLRQKH